MLTAGHIVTKVVPWITGITLTGLVIYWISRIIRYWGSDSWTLTSGKVERYDRANLYERHAQRHVFYASALQLFGL